MKNIVVYYLVIIVPLLGLFFAAREQWMSGWAFFVSILFYALVYRTLTDGARLIQKGIISRRDMRKLFLPGWRLTYFRALYLS